MRRDVGTALPFLHNPEETDTEEFIELYGRKYDVEPTYADAYEILGGLMRFLYLTRIKPVPGEDEGEKPDHAGTGEGEMHDTSGNGSLQ